MGSHQLTFGQWMWQGLEIMHLLKLYHNAMVYCTHAWLDVAAIVRVRSSGSTAEADLLAALAQAALAVHGTRITGREAARQLLLSAHRGPSRPASLLRRLQRADPQAQRWLAHHQSWSPEVGLP